MEQEEANQVSGLRKIYFSAPFHPPLAEGDNVDEKYYRYSKQTRYTAAKHSSSGMLFSLIGNISVGDLLFGLALKARPFALVLLSIAYGA